jgi:hypothetical protein
MKTLFALMLLLPIAAVAQTAPAPATPPAAKLPPAPAAPINCADWHKNSEGEWHSAPNTVVSYEGQQLTLNKATVDQGQYFIKDQDVYTLVDSTCGG